VKPRRIRARAVLFDWDGTLLDSFRSDSRAYLHLFRTLGVNWGVSQLGRYYSPDWYRVYRAARIPRARWKEADRLWAFAYAKESPELLPGVRRLLRVLDRQFVLGLVTSGNRSRVRRQLRDFRLAPFFSVCVCAEDAPRRKPDPAPLGVALRRLRLSSEVCVYVGDSAEDIEMARRAGVRAIGVAGPFPTARRARAARPDVWLRSIVELPGRLAPMAED
jgi:HAD superfamily hydrolase (TIGR01549 family)